MTREKHAVTNYIRVMFEDGMSTFLLLCDAVFEKLAGHLGHLAEQNQGRAIACGVKLDLHAH